MIDQAQFFDVIRSMYPSVSRFLREHTAAEILQTSAQCFGISNQKIANYPMGGYGKGKTSGSYSVVLQDLIENVDRYDWIYEHLADDRSRFVFSRLIHYRLLPDYCILQDIYDGTIPQYFDPAIVSCTENEVFVDCGGYIGDTSESFIKCFGTYRAIHVYEPDEHNIARCTANLKQYPNIFIHQAGVGERSGMLHFNSADSAGSFVSASENTETIKVIALDEDIQEPVTFIKMDIEGFEISALLGAKEHIRRDCPKLAICTYHIVSDLWEIPMLIHAINPNYTFYFRHYHEDQNWETVLYAIPKKQVEIVSPKVHKPKRVLALQFDGKVPNMLLTKDFGMVPYLLYKDHGCDVSILTVPIDTYTHIDRYLKGLKLEFMQTGSYEEQMNYIMQHSKEIDLLLLHGPYSQLIEQTITYKKLNPNGKVYLATDANSGWMDRIEWADPEFREFLDCCDLVGASGHAIQKHLNEKWPWKIRYLPNGYYNFENPGYFSMPDFTQKKNVILTVSRLGIQQKATDILMNSFAEIAHQIPDWTLRLVGPVADEFQPFIKEYFQQYPHLRSRVEMTGMMVDRTVLQREFENAKVFAMPSRWEGTPNVISQALISGCAMAVTRFEAWKDCIDDGRCGVVAEINDVPGFSQKLLELCRNQQLESMCRRAYEYGIKNYDMRKVVDHIYYFLFGGEE